MDEINLRRQYGALPWFRDGKGEVRVVLITTRETGRWSIPRGNPMKGKGSREAASIEAYEEAGVIGRMGRKSLGVYDYGKRVGPVVRPTRVKVYPLRVGKRLKAWPESDQRLVEDFDVEVAATLVDEPELAEIIASFAPKDRKAKAVASPSTTSGRAKAKAPAKKAAKPKGKVAKGKAVKDGKAKSQTPKVAKAKTSKAETSKGRVAKPKAVKAQRSVPKVAESMAVATKPDANTEPRSSGKQKSRPVKAGSRQAGKAKGRMADTATPARRKGAKSRKASREPGRHVGKGAKSRRQART